MVGFPNVGKSTLISTVSGAKPVIANYHFTTLTPVLGVVYPLCWLPQFAPVQPSLGYFQRVLITAGIIDKLEAMGIEEGDTVSILNFEFDYVR